MRIGFLALSQAHQHLHWIPAARELARTPGLRVDVLCPSRAGIRFIRRYDPDRRLRMIWTPAALSDGLFELPPRKRVQRLHGWLYRRYPLLVTTESTSARLRDDPRFRAALVRIRHGVGDTATRIDDSRLKQFDLSLVGGEKDKRRLVAAGLGSEENVVVAGYAKFELVRPPERLFDDDRPIVLYNPHARPDLSSWPGMGEALVREMERLQGWNFVVAPHVKLMSPPEIRSRVPHVRIDRGSIRSIDMTYTQAASIYLGDASSQVYEFLTRPRPCIFVDAHGVDWRGREEFAHFALGQVITRPEELGPALARARALQPRYEALQRAALADSIDASPEPASKRQARAILALIERLGIGRAR
ncbi:glycosyl transferase [Myxococcota bacterium]|nr:glycosyl transferase [Myxococcota bacterium]